MRRAALICAFLNTLAMSLAFLFLLFTPDLPCPMTEFGRFWYYAEICGVAWVMLTPLVLVLLLSKDS